MNFNFKKLSTREDWEGCLSDIIDAARKTVSAKDGDGITEANDLLNKFIDASPAEKPWSTDLDDHAREALGQLALDLATATNDDLEGRTEELRRIAKAVAATASDNERAAASIRHDALVQALTTAMNAAKAAKDLQTAVKDNADDGKLSDAAENLLEAISKFKDVVGNANP